MVVSSARLSLQQFVLRNMNRVIIHLSRFTILRSIYPKQLPSFYRRFAKNAWLRGTVKCHDFLKLCTDISCRNHSENTTEFKILSAPSLSVCRMQHLFNAVWKYLLANVLELAFANNVSFYSPVGYRRFCVYAYQQLSLVRPTTMYRCAPYYSVNSVREALIC